MDPFLGSTYTLKSAERVIFFEEAARAKQLASAAFELTPSPGVDIAYLRVRANGGGGSFRTPAGCLNLRQNRVTF